MAVYASQGTVTAANGTLIATADTDGQSVALRNRGTPAIYLGGAADVTSTTGFQLDSGETLSADLGPRESLYAITASGTATVHVLSNRAG